MQATRRNLTSTHYLRLAEKISLEIGKAHVLCLLELVWRLQFLRQHLAFRGAKSPQHAHPLFERRGQYIDLDQIRVFAEDSSRVIRSEIIERDQVPRLFQTLASRYHPVFRFHRFENLDHGLGRRQQGYQVFKQDIAGAVHKRACVVAKRAHAQH